MIENQNIRQILAIMATDIVNYTETMNNDEDKAWEYLKKQRNIIKPTVSKMNGQTFKEMGDGTFSKFRSAIDAVKCALKIQEDASSNDLPIRIAVHLGDVMDDGIDVIGMGVNIASRINSLANSGSIVVSDDVWRQVRGQSNMEGKSIGEQDIKGYHKSIEVYELAYNPDSSVAQIVKMTETVTITDEEGKKVKTERARQEYIKKVAVFPFDYKGENKDMEWLQYGIPFGCCISLLQDELIELQFPSQQELGYWDFMRKIRKIGFEKGMNVPLTLKKKIAAEIHARFFVVGEIIYDNDLIIKTKIYNTANGQLVSEIAQTGINIFSLMDQLSLYYRKEVGIPKDHIESATNLPATELITESKDAYEQFIKGIFKRDFDHDYEASINHLKKALDIDSSFCLGACSLWNSCEHTNTEEYQLLKDDAIKKVLQHIYKVPSRLAFRIKVNYYCWHLGKPQKALKVIEMWMKQYPTYLEPYIVLAKIYTHQIKFSEAIKAWEQVLDMDPNYYNAYNEIQHIYCHHMGGHYDKALEYAEKYMEKCPSEAKSFANMADIYLHMGDYDMSKDYFEQAFMMESDIPMYILGIAQAEMKMGNFNEAEEQFEQAITLCKNSRQKSMYYCDMSDYHKMRGKIQKSLECLNERQKYFGDFLGDVDYILLKLLGLENMVYINETDTAMKEVEELGNELVHPWNLLIGFGSILIGGCAEKKEPIQKGLKNLEEFLSIKDYRWLNNLKYWGDAFIKYIDGEFDQAIESINKADYINKWWKEDGHVWITRCYNKKQDYSKAIDVGRNYLKTYPNDPLLIFEIAKAYIENGEKDKANENLTKLLGIWEDADENYIYFQEAKQLWKELNYDNMTGTEALKIMAKHQWELAPAAHA